MKSEIETLTCLRGVAAIWVVLFHYRHHMTPLMSGAWIERGYLGVDMFFVLSGFILCYVYKNELLRGDFNYRGFLIRRIARLYPVHLVTLLFAVLIFWVGGKFNLVTGSDRHLADIWSHILMLHAWGIAGGLHLNYPSWSISAEFFAYILFPVLAISILKQSKLVAVVGSTIFFFVWISSFNWLILPFLSRESIFQTTYDFSILRIVPEFILGLASAHFVIGRKIPHLGFAVTVIIVALALALWIQSDVLFVITLPTLIMALYTWEVKIWKWLRWLGSISFSVYMVHGLVEMIAFKAVEVLFGIPDGRFPIYSMPIFVAVAIIFGWLCWRIVEVPGRYWILRVASTGAENPKPR